jgi:hypothetical protein
LSRLSSKNAVPRARRDGSRQSGKAVSRETQPLVPSAWPDYVLHGAFHLASLQHITTKQNELVYSRYTPPLLATWNQRVLQQHDPLIMVKRKVKDDLGDEGSTDRARRSSRRVSTVAKPNGKEVEPSQEVSAIYTLECRLQPPTVSLR